MSFRFLLVGLVASLGVDYPQPCDVDNWMRSGRDWIQARICEFENRMTEVQETESIASSNSDDADLAFSTLMDEIACDLASESRCDADPGATTLAMDPTQEPLVDTAEIPVAEISEVDGAWIEAVLASDRSMDLPESVWVTEEIATLSGDRSEPAATPADAELEGSPLVDATEFEASESQLTRALELTGQAMQAWLSLVTRVDAQATH